MSRKRIVICDDHEIIREAVRNRLDKFKDVEVVGEAADGIELLDIARRLDPDLILIDIEMPGQNGIETVRKLRGQMPDLPVLILSAHGEADVVELALTVGATGFLLKSSTADEMAKAIGAALEGKRFLGEGVIAGTGSENEIERMARLTPREIQILGLLAEGKRAQGIADELHLRPATVYTHVRNTVQKLDVDTRTQAVAIALRYSFLQVEASD